jgi:hypothetical protein
MAEPEHLNFHSLLKNELERRLCEQFVFKFESLLHGIDTSLRCFDAASGSLCSLRVNTALLIKFLAEMSGAFSKLYSKVHVLEEARFVHLHEQMHARVYLFRLVRDMFVYALSLFNIEAIRRV